MMVDCVDGWSVPFTIVSLEAFPTYEILLSEMKKALVPLREQGQKLRFLRYHLVCR